MVTDAQYSRPEMTAEIILPIINFVDYYYFSSENTTIKNITLSINSDIQLGEKDLLFLSNKYNFIESSELSKCVRVEDGLIIVFKSIKYVNDDSNVIVKIDFATSEPNVFGKAEFEYNFKNNFWSLQKRQLFSTSIGK